MKALRVIALGIRGMPNVQGGVETHAEQLYSRLVALGCDVEVLVRSPFVPPSVRSVGAIRVRRLWAPRQQGLEAMVHSLIGVVYAIFRRPDILHIHSIGPAIVTPIARLFGVKTVVTYHSQNYEHEKWGRVARWTLRIGESLGMRAAHARIAVSHVLAAMIRQRYQRVVEYIPNGVSPADLRTDTDVLDGYRLEPGRYFLLVGRVTPEKRSLDLVRAAAALPPGSWKLALVGGVDGGDYGAAVQEEAAKCGAILTGYQTGVALAQLYTHAGAFVLPSAHEGLPIALLEALSFGLPVLASDIPTNLEIGLEPGRYFPMGDVKELAASMARCQQTPDNEEARAVRRKWVAERYDWDQIAGQTLAVYRNVAR